MSYWFLVFSVLPLGGQAYVMWRSYHILPDIKWLRWGVALLELAVFGLSFFAMSQLEDLSLGMATVLYEVGTSWFIILLYLFIAFLLLDIGRLVRLIPKHWLFDNARSSILFTLVIVGIFVYGNLHYYDKYRQELTYTSPKITRPIKIVMMSDMHLGYHNSRADLKKWIGLVNAEEPDLVLIAGDMLDGRIRPVREEKMHEEFKALKAPVYACFGNHDFYTGKDEDRSFCELAGIRILEDSVAYVGEIALVGRDDRTNRQRKSLDEIMEDIDRSKYIIELDHQPFDLEDAERCGVDLELAGHTHDGQVWPINWIVKGMYECSFGKWQRGNTHYYISSGMGIWGPKFRIGTRSEYGVIEVKGDHRDHRE
jgi:hypothetical protein